MRLLRLARGLSQRELATALGLSFQQVQKYERGTNRISASKLYEISRVLGVEVVSLFADVAATNAARHPDGDAGARLAGVDYEITAKLSRLRDAELKRRILDLLIAVDDCEGARRPPPSD